MNTSPASPGWVRRVDRATLAEPLPGLRVQPLADEASGARRCVVNYMEVDPGRAGPGTHVHEFDQYYLVVEGELTVEVALEKHVVRTRDAGHPARRGAAPAVQRGRGHRKAHLGAGAGPGARQTLGPRRVVRRERRRPRRAPASASHRRRARGDRPARVRPPSRQPAAAAGRRRLHRRGGDGRDSSSWSATRNCRRSRRPRAEPFVGITTDGVAIPGLFELGDEGAPAGTAARRSTRLPGRPDRSGPCQGRAAAGGGRVAAVDQRVPDLPRARPACCRRCPNRRAEGGTGRDRGLHGRGGLRPCAAGHAAERRTGGAGRRLRRHADRVLLLVHHLRRAVARPSRGAGSCRGITWTCTACSSAGRWC